MLKRRSFLAGVLAAGAAPAIVRAGSLMRLPAPKFDRLFTGEIGAIDSFSFIASDPLQQPTADAMRSIWPAAVWSGNLAEKFWEASGFGASAARDFDAPFGKTESGILLVPRDIVLELKGRSC